MALASIQKITKIIPCPNSDFLEICTVLGWQVVTKKDEYQVGDNCIYIQIDTVCPSTEQFEFLRDRNFRVRTIKLRKQLSQGLIIPLTDKMLISSTAKYLEGADVSEEIGIKKYEKPNNNPSREEKPRMPKIWYKKWIYLFKYNILYKAFPNLQPLSRSPFPSNLVSKTDEERIQNIPQTLEKYKGEEFVVSYKMDGSSITIIHNKVLGKSKYRICSRNFELHDTKNEWYKTFVNTNFQVHIDNLVKHYNTNDIIVQGECIGNFNGNHHNLSKDEIRLFNIIVNGKRVNQIEFLQTCGLLHIPHCELFKYIVLNHSMDEILKISEQPDILNPKVPLEGLVWRNIEDNFSFKVINNNYALTEK